MEYPATANGRKAGGAYIFLVENKTYYAHLKMGKDAPPFTPILYNPCDPSDNVIGPIVPWWMVLSFSLGTGAFFLFVENSFDQAQQVAPQEAKIANSGPSIHHTFPARSVTVLRIGTP
jgi:hypothetical protein